MTAGLYTTATIYLTEPQKHNVMQSPGVGKSRKHNHTPVET